MRPTLLVLAAGRGSRYGGLKQTAIVGPSGESIIDYSIFDAIRSGFDKVVFVIRPEIAAAFKDFVGNKFAINTKNSIEVAYAFQSVSMLPAGYQPPSRTKPWGTAHAIWCARHQIKTPFVVINGDDFYGPHRLPINGRLPSNSGGKLPCFCHGGLPARQYPFRVRQCVAGAL